MAEKEDGKISTIAKKEKGTANLLLDNFIALQRVLTDVSVKLSSLTEQISQLLKLFESAAKNFKERKEGEAGAMNKISEKIDSLAEQNKVIAKGLSLVEEDLSKEKPKPLPEFRF